MIESGRAHPIRPCQRPVRRGRLHPPPRLCLANGWPRATTVQERSHDRAPAVPATEQPHVAGAMLLRQRRGSGRSYVSHRQGTRGDG